MNAFRRARFECDRVAYKATDRQAQRVAYFRGHAQLLDRLAQLCLVGQEQTAVEELRATAQHQLEVRPPGLLGGLSLKRL